MINVAQEEKYHITYLQKEINIRWSCYCSQAGAGWEKISAVFMKHLAHKEANL